MNASPFLQRQWLAYGALGLPLAMAALPIYVHVPQLYAEVGISLTMLGAILLVARLLDAGMDPLLGWWSDRVPRRQGLILLALPCLAAGMLGLLHPSAERTEIWLLLALLLTYFGFSLGSIAYQAWGAELGRSSQERTVLTASREGFGLAGVVLASILPLLLADNAVTGLSRLAWLFAPLLLLMAAITLLGSPKPSERMPMAPSRQPSFSIAVLGQALSDRPFRRLLSIFVLNGIAAALPATLVLFFVADVLQAAAWGGVFLALYFAAGIAGLPLWLSLSRSIGRVRAWLVAMALACLAFLGALGLGAGDVLPFAMVCLASGLALGADLALPPAFLADMAERPSAEAGAGAYFGWWNLVAKLNLALAAGIALPVLGSFGYHPGGQAGITALVLAYCLLPVLFKVGAALLLWRWQRDLEVMQ